MSFPGHTVFLYKEKSANVKMQGKKVEFMRKKFIKEVGEWLYNPLIMFSCLLEVLLFPILLFFEIQRRNELRKAQTIKNEKFKLYRANERNNSIISSYTKMRKFRDPTPDEVVTYCRAKKQEDANSKRLSELRNKDFEHIINARKYQVIIEKITLEYYIKKLFAKIGVFDERSE